MTVTIDTLKRILSTKIMLLDGPRWDNDTEAAIK